jgi:hypothetical protein
MKYAGILSGVLCVLVFVLPVCGLTSRSGEGAKVALDEIIDDDIIMFGQDITIEGTVLGNVYAFGQSVKIAGDVGGSVFTGGANVTIDAKSVETVWAAGGNVQLLGNVTRNAILAGGAICICDAAYIGKDLGVYGGKLSVEGSVVGTVRGNMGKFMLSGKSGRVKVNAEEATLKSSAEIQGDFILTSVNEPVIEEGATIVGEQKVLKPEAKESGQALAALAPMFAFLFAMIKLLVFIAKIICGILLIALFRRYVRRIMDTLVTKPWQSLGWGFLGVIVIPVAIVILFLVLVGYPLGIFFAYVYTVIWYLASIFVSLVIGEQVVKLFKKQGEISLYLSFIIGIVILFVIGFIPILNFLVRIFTLLFGFGAVAMGTWFLLKDMREKELL